MDREKLFSHLEKQYISKREMIARVPLGIQPEALWQELVSRRRSKGTVLPIIGCGGSPYWYVTTDRMVTASEKIVAALFENESEFDPYAEAPPVETLEEVFYTSYVEGSTISICDFNLIHIATVLTEDGIPTPGGRQKWSTSTVKSILTNEKYKGDALLQKTYCVDFLTKKYKVNEGEIPQYYVEDNHEAIIPPDMFEMVQREVERRDTTDGHYGSAHVFSCRIKCGECGSWYGSKVWHSTDKYRRQIWQCNHKYAGGNRCGTPHLTDDQIQAAFIAALNKLLSDKGEVLQCGREMLPVLYETSALEKERDELQQETQVVSELVQQCIYENAHVALDQADYQKRYAGLTARFETANARLETVMQEIHRKQTQRADYEAFLTAFEKLPDQVTEFELDAWYSLADHITVYGRKDIRVTFKNGQEICAYD